MYNPTTCKVIVSRNVIFNEEDEWNWSKDAALDDKISLEVSLEGLSDQVPSTTPTSHESSLPPIHSGGNSENSSSTSGNTSSSDEVSPSRVKSLKEL